MKKLDFQNKLSKLILRSTNLSRFIISSFVLLNLDPSIQSQHRKKKLSHWCFSLVFCKKKIKMQELLFFLILSIRVTALCSFKI